MTHCDKNQEKLLLFGELDQKEQNEIMEHMEVCESCRSQLEQYRQIEAGLAELTNPKHMDDDLLVRYSVHLSDPDVGDYDGRKLSRREISALETHVAQCASCEARLTKLVEEYQQTAAYFESSNLPDMMLTPATLADAFAARVTTVKQLVQGTLAALKESLSAPIPRFFPVVLGAVAMLFAVVWWGPFYRSDNPYWDFAAVSQDRVASLTRGSLSPELQVGVAAFVRGDYSSAIARLEAFAANNPEHPSVAYAYYLAGVASLQQARTDVLGRFRDVDTELVDQAIGNLHNAELASTNLGIKENCHWYLAKAFLLLEDVAQAQEQLQKIISGRGRRYGEAQQLMHALDSVQSK